MYQGAKLSLRDLFDQQRQYVDYFFENLHLPQAEKAVEMCLACKGLLVFTGVGKSGIIAEKIAMTLISVGTRALFLPTLNFLHGDIGVVGENDLIVMLSKSGETSELLDLLPYIRENKSQTLALVSEGESRLAKMADLAVELPVEKELCPFDLAPTTSTTVQLLFGDLLAIALMREKGFSLEEYARNHPSGSIGKKITQTVADLMKKGDDLPLCHPEDRLVDILVELTNKKCGCLLVVENGDLCGIFTDGDLRRALQEKQTDVMEKTMGELMCKNPIIVSPQDLAHTAMQTMQEKRYVMMAPVTEGNRVVGLIHMHDIIHQGLEND